MPWDTLRFGNDEDQAFRQGEQKGTMNKIPGRLESMIPRKSSQKIQIHFFFKVKESEIWKNQCYGLNCIPNNSYVEVLTPTTLECDCIPRQGLSRVS